MKGYQAINRAMCMFERAGIGDIRAVSLQEGSGSGNFWSSVDVRIEYAVDGDYTESDKDPYIVRVRENGGKITAERVGR